MSTLATKVPGGILAIDQGTTSTRALLIRAGCSPTITHAIEHQQHYPKPGWVEHSAEELVTNIQICINKSPDVSAIGIDNQGESCLAWDAHSKEAICPVIVWQDNRTINAIEDLKAQGHRDYVMEKTGLPLDPYFSASKLSWITEHVPAAKVLLKKGKLRLGTTDAFFLDRLTGNFVTDLTTASRTSLMDIHTGKWDEKLCQIFNVPIESLPRIVSTTGDFGVVKKSNGAQIPIVTSVVDQQASLYGHGCHQSGDAKITFGTGAFALSVTGSKLRQSPEQGLLPTVAWQRHGQPTIYALDGGVYCAGSAINWGGSLGLFTSFDEINHFSSPPAIQRHLAFVPALSGLACPHWDRRATGLWIGLSLDTNPMDMMQSMLEGIAFRAAEVIAAMTELSTGGDEISIDGGVSANPYFCQFLADTLNRTIVVQRFPELTAIGTGRLVSSYLEETGHTGNEMSVSEGQDRMVYEPNQGASQSELYIETFTRAVERSKSWA
ncbi:MAG: glycerol kinase [Gammaproteobacteria bacterium]|nr:glycerol kinase [Gammaproteobacteria bacterium]